MKKRLDLLIIEKGLIQTRQRARAMIMAGKVLVNDKPVDKPGTLVSEGHEILLRGEDIPYVSRGGLKLEAALQALGVNLAGLICLDLA